MRCKLRAELAAEVQRRRAVFAQNQSEAGFAELDEYSQNMLSEAFWTLNIASSQFNEHPVLGSRSKSSSN